MTRSNKQTELAEYRIVGPPGTGKTSEVAKQVGAAVRAGKRVVVASLTRAAAAEAAGRDMPIGRESVGTLHSFAYRALGAQGIADSPKMLAEWNKEYPFDTLTGGRDVDSDNMDTAPGEGGGDERFNTMNLNRAMMIPRDIWPPSVRQFADQWNGWKEANDLLDFTDLIEQALDCVEEAPNSPDILFVDEAQDMDALEMALVRKWATAAGGLVTVGDPDQAIYKWRGADPKVFYESPIPQDHERILSQSYRVPRDVWSQAMGWIGRDQTRRQVAYQPRDEEGKVIRRDATWKTPDGLLLNIEDALANGKSVMALASCSYMLRPLIAVLRQAGIPFHNPYRRNRGDWNPLGRARGKVSGSERLLAFTQMGEMGEWSRENLWRWLEAVKVKNVYQKDGKEWLELLDDTWVSHDDLHMILTDEAIGSGMSGDLGWLSQQLLASKRRGMEYPMEIYEARGREALEKSPQVVVGTVHSVKGAEADVVCLFPDLSPRGMEEWDSGDPHQQADVYRLFYVGMTRAKESLVIAEPGGGMAVDLSSDG